MERIGRLRIVLAMVCGAGIALGSLSHTQAQATPPAGTADTGAANVTVKAGTVELHVQGADLRRVLQLLSTQSKTNIIATKDVTGTVTADLYGVTFIEALDAVLRSAGFEYVREGKFILVMTPKEKAEREAAARKMIVQVFRLNYITSTDAKSLITPVLSEKGYISLSPAALTGIVTSKTTTGGNALGIEDVIVVRDYPEVIEKVSEIIKELDVRPPQVLIEATLLRATLNETNALGVNFDILAGVDFRSIGATSDPAYGNLTRGALPAAKFDDPGASFESTLTGTNFPTGGLSIGFIYNEVAMFIRALETVTDVTVMANPKLLVVNKARGEFIVGDRDGYATTTITEGIATETVEFLETGTQLVVRPFVASDGYIRMEIHPEDSSGGISDTGLPFEATTECTTNILIKDGHTIVIGGLFRDSVNMGRRQIPILGNLPTLGTLFRSRTDVTQREEVIILITPHIIRGPIDEQVAEQIKDDCERIRLGARQGMMWFGRERLAQTHMRWAREHVATGDNESALWDVEMALSLRPTMIEALDLKERLTHRTIWATEPRYSTASYVIQRMIMQELGQPFEDVAIPNKPRNGMELDKQVREALGIGPRTQRQPLRDLYKKRVAFDPHDLEKSDTHESK